MRKVFEIVKKSAGLWLALIIIAQTVIYVLAGMSKAYFHMDEVYSYGLANHERVQIYETEGFYDTWHEGSYYDEYLTVGDDERGDFWPVYENQRNDVHPPLFYFLLRIGMEMTPGQFSKWTGLVLNILIAGVSTVVLWMVVKNLTNGQKVKSLVLTAVVALGMAAVSTVVYIRMYELLTLWVLLTTWLHLKLLETREVKPRLLVAIGAVELLGGINAILLLVLFGGDVYGVCSAIYTDEEMEGAAGVCCGDRGGGVVIVGCMAVRNSAHVLWVSRGRGDGDIAAATNAVGEFVGICWSDE